MRFKKLLLISLLIPLVCSCQRYEARNDYYLGEIAPAYYFPDRTSWGVTFERYHKTSINKDEFYLDFTMRMKSISNLTNPSYRLVYNDVHVDGTRDLDTGCMLTTAKHYYCDIDKNIEYNGYDIFILEDFSGDFSYTFFIRLPNTIYKEQGWETDDVILFDFLPGFCFYTCTRKS